MNARILGITSVALLLAATATATSARTSADGEGVGAELSGLVETTLIPWGTLHYQVAATVTVKNSGAVPAMDVWVGLFSDLEGAPNPTTDTFVDVRSIPSIGPGEAATLDFVIGPMVQGEHTLSFLLDPLGAIAESNEFDNLVAAPVVVPMPELSWFDVGLRDSSVRVQGQSLICTTVVENRGTKDVVETAVRAVLRTESGQVIESPILPVAAIAAGDSRVVNLPKLSVPSGVYEVELVVDPLDSLAEVEELDNRGSAGAAIVSPTGAPGFDLFVASAEVFTGDTGASATVEVHNAGGDRADGVVEVRLYQDQSDHADSRQLVSIAEGTIANGLDSQSSSTIVVDWPGFDGRVTEIWVEVSAPAGGDTQGVNDLYGPLLVGGDTRPSRADLVVTDFRATVVEDTEESATVDYLVEVTNIGIVAQPVVEVMVFPDAASLPGSTSAVSKLVTVDTQGLAPGESRILHVEWVGAPSGGSSAWVRVDPFNFASEASESNNVAGPVPVFVAGSEWGLEEHIIESSSSSGVVVTDPGFPTPLADCAQGVLLSGDACRCGGSIATTGYCCDEGPVAVPCWALPEESVGPAPEAVVGNGEAGFAPPVGSSVNPAGAAGDLDLVEAAGPSDGAGCQQTGTSTHTTAGLLALAVWMVALRRRHA